MRSPRRPFVLADARWTARRNDARAREFGGIGRFAREVLARLPGVERISDGLSVLHPLEPAWLALVVARRRPDVYFTPGFNPPLASRSSLVFTIHDLIHVRFPEERDAVKQAYYRAVVRPAARRAAAILTVSDFSKREILDWSGVDERRVVVVGNGVGPEFVPDGPRHSPGFPYLLYVGNRKPHKNVPRLLAAFARSSVSTDVQLLLTGRPDEELAAHATRLGIERRVVFVGDVDDGYLAALYRGAVAVVLPSLYEGFGLPAVEAMASGTPLVASTATAVPETVGNAAAALFDPFDVDELAAALRRVVDDEALREASRERGLERAKAFTWDRTAALVRAVLAAASERSR